MKCVRDTCLLYNDGFCTYSRVIIVPGYQCSYPGRFGAGIPVNEGYRPSNATTEQKRSILMGKRMPIDYVSDPPELPTAALDEKPYDIRYATHVLSEDEPDMVNRPPHYTQGGVECIDAIRAAVTGKPPYEAWLTGQIIKYVWRYNFFKNGKQDLEKAEFYLKRLIDAQEKANE